MWVRSTLFTDGQGLEPSCDESKRANLLAILHVSLGEFLRFCEMGNLNAYENVDFESTEQVANTFSEAFEELISPYESNTVPDGRVKYTLHTATIHRGSEEMVTQLLNLFKQETTARSIGPLLDVLVAFRDLEGLTRKIPELLHSLHPDVLQVVEGADDRATSLACMGKVHLRLANDNKMDAKARSDVVNAILAAFSERGSDETRKQWEPLILAMRPVEALETALKKSKGLSSADGNHDILVAETQKMFEADLKDEDDEIPEGCFTKLAECIKQLQTFIKSNVAEWIAQLCKSMITETEAPMREAEACIKAVRKRREEALIAEMTSFKNLFGDEEFRKLFGRRPLYQVVFERTEQVTVPPNDGAC